MRYIKAKAIEKKVIELCVRANTVLRQDIREAIKFLYDSEKEGSLSKKSLAVLLKNADIAEKEEIAICQDTGLVTVFVELGQEVIIEDGLLGDVVNSGVEKAYKDNFFRKSIVADPLLRNNTGTNTPCDLHVDITKGNKVRISVMPKGFGSENKGAISMMNPTQKSEEIIDFCVKTVKKAGADACPPYVLGVGLGGTMNSCTHLAKKALLRPINISNPEKHIANLEEEIKEKTNALGIGIMGLGGASTVMGVNIEASPTHIAGLPVAVNIGCHALRSASGII